MKVAIVGVGRVGAALGMVLVARHLVDELVLVGRRREAVEAEALDLLHASAFGNPTRVYAGQIDATAGSDVIVLAFGEGVSNATRTACGEANYATLKRILPDLAALSPNAVLLIATNPVDVLTTLAIPLSGLPASRVIGTGTLVDTMRLRSILSEQLRIHPLDLRAYVLGEHGDSQFAAFSSASMGGARLNLSRDQLCAIEQATRQVAYDIVRGKGYTNHGIALAAAEVIEAVVHNSHQIMPLSVSVEGFAGINDVSLSLPVVIGREGVLRRLDIELNVEETAAFVRSADTVRTQVQTIVAGNTRNKLEGTTIRV